MQHNKNINKELEHLAQLGYNAFPDAENDLPKITQKIRERAGNSNGSYNGFSIIAMALFFGITAFFAVYNSPIIFPSYTQFFSNEQPAKELSKDVTLDTIQITHKVKKQNVTEKFEEPFELDTSAEWGKAEQLASIDPITLGMDSVLFQDQELKFVPNASYIFLYDLKVADYHGYYFNTPQRIIVHGSLTADKASYDKNNDAHIPYREYYLHDIIKDAMYAFKQKNYKQCISLLETITQYSKNDVNCDFYRGMCYFQLKNYEQAYTFFNSALSNKINVFAEESTYYLALSANKTNRSQEGKKLLEEIAYLKGFYSQKAKEELAKP